MTSVLLNSTKSQSQRASSGMGSTWVKSSWLLSPLLAKSFHFIPQFSHLRTGVIRHAAVFPAKNLEHRCIPLLVCALKQQVWISADHPEANVCCPCFTEDLLQPRLLILLDLESYKHPLKSMKVLSPHRQRRSSNFFDNWSHSLVSVAILATLLASAFLRRGKSVFVAIWLAVFSHFLLGFPVHQKRLALAPLTRMYLGWDVLAWGSRPGWLGQSTTGGCNWRFCWCCSSFMRPERGELIFNREPWLPRVGCSSEFN
jgi:hypothetical protein